MNKDLYEKLEKYNTEDKVRYISLEVFPSGLFIILSLMFTLLFIFSAILFIMDIMINFSFDRIIACIIPALMMFGFWNTYLMASSRNIIKTTGLKLIRGIVTFLIILFSFLILISFLAFVYFVLFENKADSVLLLLICILALLGYAFWVFKQALTNIIIGFEEGSTNTDYYSTSITWLIIFIVILIIITVVRTTFDPTKIPELSRRAIELTTLSKFEKIAIVINNSFYGLILGLMAIFLKRLKFLIENINRFYPNSNSTPVNKIDYKISGDIIASDNQIDDRHKFDN